MESVSDDAELKNLLGWSLLRCQRGYVRAHRKINGRVSCIYLGKCRESYVEAGVRLARENLKHGFPIARFWLKMLGV